jgi:hypothetical protein
VVCTRVPREGEPGRFLARVHTVEATTNAILELAGHLTGLQIEKVVLESTSDYWRPFYYLLEAAGLTVELVKPDRRRLPRPIGSEEAENLPGLNLQVQVTDRGNAAVSLCQPEYLDDLRHS